MNILVTYAVDPEFAPWLKLREFRGIAAGGFTIQRTEIGRATVDFVVTGMGPVHARRAMDAVASQEYAVCIACGFAGALRAERTVGEIVVARGVREAGGAAGTFSCDAGLVTEGAASGGTGIDVLLSSDRIVTTAAEKASLAALGSAVDMESFAVLAGAQERGTPAVAIRVISDRHDQAVPVDLSTAVDERGQVSVGRVLRMAAGNPGQIAALMRLGRDSKAGAEKLARFLEGYVEKISFMERCGGCGRAVELAGRGAKGASGSAPN